MAYTYSESWGLDSSYYFKILSNSRSSFSCFSFLGGFQHRAPNVACLGKPSYKKNGKKADNVRFGRTPPKRVKSGHLLSDYRQKCVNGTRDILMLKARKKTTKVIRGTGKYWGGKDDIGGPNQANLKALAFILWCQKSISEWFEKPVNLGLKKELGLTPAPH